VKGRYGDIRLNHDYSLIAGVSNGYGVVLRDHEIELMVVYLGMPFGADCVLWSRLELVASIL
jgi:hypothetical protein